jgi:hypothetical protein
VTVAKRKKVQPWDAVFDRVRGVNFVERNYAPKTTAAELDAVEAALGVRFPLSYRAFAERFGLGGRVRRCVEMLLLIPPPNNEPRPPGRESVIRYTEMLRDPSYDTPTESQQHDTKQLVPFAASDIASYAFYPPEPTDKKTRECRIYALNIDSGWFPDADSFGTWLERVDAEFTDPEVTEPEEEARRYGWQLVYKPNPSGTDIIPYYPDEAHSNRFKTAPSTSDVAHWLAFNNHTARDLALSIRDHGRSDAYPILADALQEAGCTNADLLDSCRTGDPDIDGKWVLHVLLGKD